MKEFLKRNFAIILAFVLPIILIMVVALSTYLPSLFISTHYNFLYASCANDQYYYPYDYNCNAYIQKYYSVVDSKLVLNPIDTMVDANKNGIPDFGKNPSARIFLHDTSKNESREITLEEAKSLSLNSLLTSPDGVTVSNHYDRGGDFFPFGGGSYSYGYYLTKGKGKSRINLINNTDQYYYQNNFQFLGWALPGRN